MLERLARVVWDARMKRGVELGYDGAIIAWEDENETLHDNVRLEVRALIEALMEPSPEMLEVLRRNLANMTAPYSYFASNATARALLQSTLRTILSQPNDEGEGK